MTKRITIDLPDFLYKSIQTLKTNSEASQTDIVIRAVEDYVFKQNAKINLINQNEKNISTNKINAMFHIFP